MLNRISVRQWVSLGVAVVLCGNVAFVARVWLGPAPLLVDWFFLALVVGLTPLLFAVWLYTGGVSGSYFVSRRWKSRLLSASVLLMVEYLLTVLSVENARLRWLMLAIVAACVVWQIVLCRSVINGFRSDAGQAAQDQPATDNIPSDASRGGRLIVGLVVVAAAAAVSYSVGHLPFGAALIAVAACILIALVVAIADRRRSSIRQ